MKKMLMLLLVLAMVAVFSMPSLVAMAYTTAIYSSTPPSTTVNATIPDLLTLTVSGGSNPATPGTIDFGSITPSTAAHIVQRLDAATNAAGGYSVSASEDHRMQTIINDNNNTPHTYTIPDYGRGSAGEGFGYTLGNEPGGVFTATSSTQAFTGTTVLYNAGTTAGDTVYVQYYLNVSSTQAAGAYANTVTYTATGQF